MGNTINIPNVTGDERIGSAFNHLFRVILATSKSDETEVGWSFSNASFLHPFFLAPLSIYKQICSKNIHCIDKTSWVEGYMDLVHFNSPLLVIEGVDLEKMLEPYVSKTYIPICKFELSKTNVDRLQGILQRVIKKQSRADERIVTPMSYMLGELVDNMNEHSCGKYGYIYSQYMEKEGCIDMVIADDGITIFGSYVRSGKYMDEIGLDEALALKFATEGKSTKNLPYAENRGYGISSSEEMLVRGLKGSFFILSGGAFHRYDEGGSVSVRLPEIISWNGTIVLIRIPVKAPDNFAYTEYLR